MFRILGFGALFLVLFLYTFTTIFPDLNQDAPYSIINIMDLGNLED